MVIAKLIHITVILSIGFITLLIGLKIIGRRQVQQITPFDFISAIVLGEILGNVIYDTETNVLFVIYSVFLWSILLYIIEKVTQKSKKIRRTVQGSPVIVVNKGLIDYKVLKKERLDFNELLSLLRQKDIFSIKEIDYALIEPNGIISIIKKSQYSKPSKEDFNIPIKPTLLNLALILDGKIEIDNLKLTGHDESWLKERIKNLGVNDISKVLYAEWNENDGFYIQKFDTNNSPIIG